MTNEQREAIEYLKESVLIYKNTIPKISEAIETVLSMLKEKDKEIEEKQDKIYELEDNIDTMKQNGIFNIENFKWQLRNDNLYTRELEEFIDNYMRFYNKERGVKSGYID